MLPKISIHTHENYIIYYAPGLPRPFIIQWIFFSQFININLILYDLCTHILEDDYVFCVMVEQKSGKKTLI